MDELALLTARTYLYLIINPLKTRFNPIFLDDQILHPAIQRLRQMVDCRSGCLIQILDPLLIILNHPDADAGSSPGNVRRIRGSLRDGPRTYNRATS